MQRAQAAGQMLSASGKNAVLALDLTDLNQQVAGVLRQPGIAYVRIVDRKGACSPRAATRRRCVARSVRIRVTPRWTMACSTARRRSWCKG